MKTLSGFKKAYLIFLAACIVLSAAFLIYVGYVVKDFDNAQPEHPVKEKMEWLSSHAADGTLAAELNLNEICSNRYENNDVDYYSRAYTEKIKGAVLTYEFVAGQSSDLSKTYNILADGSTVATLSLTGANRRNRLFFFSMADWSVESFTPVLADSVYNLRLFVPEGTQVLINGLEPAPEELDNTEDVPAYSIKGLLHEPTIEYKRSDGTTLNFTAEKNIIKPAVYDYELTVPSGIKVTVNDKEASGEPDSDAHSKYLIREMTKPDIVFTDCLGNQQEYTGTDIPKFFGCTAVIPESYNLTIDGKDAESICQSTTAPHQDAALLLEKAGVELPTVKTYNISLLKPGSKAVVSDGSGNQSEFVLDEENLKISGLNGEIPEIFSEKIDVMDTAQKWSLFLTDDLPGQMHGLSTVQDFLIKDSDYYEHAYRWATGIEISFTSTHTIDGFSNEKISNFTQYSDKCFSCEVYFEKNMTLYSGSVYMGKRTDVFNSLMYFVYIDDTPDNGVDDPHWTIAVMHDVV